MIRGLVLLLLLLLSGCVAPAQHSPYCDRIAPPVPYCTRTLGRVECWANPQALPGPPPEVADGPRALTPAQRADCKRRLPPWQPAPAAHIAALSGDRPVTLACEAGTAAYLPAR